MRKTGVLYVQVGIVVNCSHGYASLSCCLTTLVLLVTPLAACTAVYFSGLSASAPYRAVCALEAPGACCEGPGDSLLAALSSSMKVHALR